MAGYLDNWFKYLDSWSVLYALKAESPFILILLPFILSRGVPGTSPGRYFSDHRSAVISTWTLFALLGNLPAKMNQPRI